MRKARTMYNGIINKFCNIVRTKKYLFLLISAFFGALAFTFSFLWFVTWVSMVFYCMILFDDAEAQPKRFFPKKFLGKYFFTFFFYHVFIYYWFLWLYPFDSMGFSKVSALSITALAWFGPSLLHGFIYSLSAPLFLLIRPRNMKKGLSRDIFDSLLISGIWLTCEALTSLGSMGFPWSRIYVTQYTALPVIQSSSLFGASFITFLIIFVNSLIACSFRRTASKTDNATNGDVNKASGIRQRSFFPALIAAAVFIANISFGTFHLIAGSGETVGSLNTVIVQGNIVSGEKWQQGASERALEKYMTLTGEACELYDADIILWPESAVPVRLSENSTLMEVYEGIAEESGAEFFTGAFYVSDKRHEGNINAIVQIGEGEIKTYAKRHLVPFGEYLPYKEIFDIFFPDLGSLSQLSGGLTPGKDTGELELNGSKLGGLVCYDSIFPALARKSALEGNEIFLLVTNDSWYKDSPAVHQHLAQAVFRAVENGRYVVRAANSGISAMITDTGKIVDSIPALAPGYITEEAYLIEEKTLYTYTGEAFLFILYAFVLINALYIKIKSTKKEKTS